MGVSMIDSRRRCSTTQQTMGRDKILLISYDFPPALSGVRRIVKFAKFLPEFGYDPMVLAATPDPTQAFDRETLREVEQHGYPVYRTPSFDVNHVRGALAAVPKAIARTKTWLWQTLNEPMREGDLFSRPAASSASSHNSTIKRSLNIAARRLGRAMRPWLYFPDDRIGWFPAAAAEACHILDYQPVRYVLTTSYPNSTHLIGHYLKQRYRIFWIADFRDGWTTNPYFANYPTKLHRLLNARWEEAVVREADLLVTVSEPIAEHLRRLSANTEKVFVIPNGFDPDDFEGPPVQEFERFTMVYTGTVFGHRSPEPLFAAMRILFDEHPDLQHEIQALFLTKWQAEHEAMIDRYGLRQNIRNLGLMTYRMALAFQRSAHLLVAIEGEAPHGEMMLTQKIFEYLAVGKPVLAITPENALAKLVRETGAGCVVHPEDIQGLVQKLYDFFLGTHSFRQNFHLLSKYHRRYQTQQLALLMDKLKSARRCSF